MGSSDVKHPCPSTVNVANFVAVKPRIKETEKTNFHIWKEQMLCLLESQGLLGFINGEIVESNVEQNELKLWRRSNRLVKGWILGSIGNDLLGAVWELQTAKEVCFELEKIFNQKAASQLQSGSNVNVHEGGESGDLSRYSPLYKTALGGDWKTAKIFFHREKLEPEAIISSCSETALHIAVSTCKANDFVNKLVELMTHDALAIKDNHGDTALHCAAMVGNTQAAITLVSKYPNWLYILNNNNRLPVQQAALNGHKDTLEYLISMSEPNVEHIPFEGQLGLRLLCDLISSELFDVALDLVDKYPNLARLRREGDGSSALSTIAAMNSVFPSGETFSLWKSIMYRGIPLKQSKREDAQATSVAGDIENTSCDLSVFNNCFSMFQIIRRVPHIKDIRNKKAKHQQALELVKCMCRQMVSLPENEALSMFSKSVILAAQHGINEIVEVIKEMYPQAVAITTGEHVIRLAAINRRKNVCNLIFKSDRRILFSNALDPHGNNLMHICAKLAPSDRLNLVPGAALQMQRELRWFKMENFVSPSLRKWVNNEGKTPQMLFTEEHKQLKAEGERWAKETAIACTIAAALIATVVFAAAFTVPGGVADKTGIPIFRH